jgi:hypothetical protein
MAVTLKLSMCRANCSRRLVVHEILPTANLPQREGDDPHGDPRTEPASVEQRGTFLGTGVVVRTCDGPCTAEQR